MAVSRVRPLLRVLLTLMFAAIPAFGVAADPGATATSPTVFSTPAMPMRVDNASLPDAPADHNLVRTAHCDHGCPPTTCKVCVQVPSTVKTTKVVYEYKEVEYCLPRSRPLSCLFKGCASGCEHCTEVLTRRVLVKKLIPVEKPTTICEPRVVPIVPCADPRCQGGPCRGHHQ